MTPGSKTNIFGTSEHPVGSFYNPIQKFSAVLVPKITVRSIIQLSPFLAIDHSLAVTIHFMFTTVHIHSRLSRFYYSAVHFRSLFSPARMPDYIVRPRKLTLGSSSRPVGLATIWKTACEIDSNEEKYVIVRKHAIFSVLETQNKTKGSKDEFQLLKYRWPMKDLWSILHRQNLKPSPSHQ